MATQASVDFSTFNWANFSLMDLTTSGSACFVFLLLHTISTHRANGMHREYLRKSGAIVTLLVIAILTFCALFFESGLTMLARPAHP